MFSNCCLTWQLHTVRGKHYPPSSSSLSMIDRREHTLCLLKKAHHIFLLLGSQVRKSMSWSGFVIPCSPNTFLLCHSGTRWRYYMIESGYGYGCESTDVDFKLAACWTTVWSSAPISPKHLKAGALLSNQALLLPSLKSRGIKFQSRTPPLLLFLYPNEYICMFAAVWCFWSPSLCSTSVRKKKKKNFFFESVFLRLCLERTSE